MADVEAHPALRKRTLSLRARLGIGAACLGAGTLLTAFILFVGLNAVADRLDTALASETRMVRYASLSQQAATFLVVASEVVQSGQSSAVRMDRVSPIVAQLRRTFAALHSDTEVAVAAARDIGLDAQSRYATQSLGLARMQAMLDNTVRGLGADTRDEAELRAYLDSFASSFDALISQAANTEILFRNAIIEGIDTLRHRLALTALAIAIATLGLVVAFYFGLVRPQFARLDGLRNAAARIGQEDFDVALPVTRLDEIGQVSSETNRMAAALSRRKDEVQSEWSRLNETIAQRTEELRAANATLEEIDRNRRRFFADVSHELRTPLTVILMEAQIGQKLGGDTAQAFGTIEARAARLNRRIDDLLRVAQSDSGQLELDIQAVALDDLIREVVHEVQAETESAGLELVCSDMPEARLRCDSNWVRQVLVSLIRNVVRHAREGGVVKLAGSVQDGMLVLSVFDHGPGIAPETLPKMFDRFAQGNNPHAMQGFGLGLALARWVIETQGGTITAISPLPAPERPEGVTGTLIRLCLPLWKE